MSNTKISLCSCADNVGSSLLQSLSPCTCRKRGGDVPSQQQEESVQVSSNEAHPPTIRPSRNKFKAVQVKYEMQKSSREEPRTRAPPPKLPNATRINPDSTYGVLMDVAMETSKRLLNDNKNKVPSSISVVAGYKRGTRSGKNSNTDFVLTIPSITRCHTRESHISDRPNTAATSNKGPLEAVLSKLPHEPCTKIVKDWIHSSSISSLPIDARRRAEKLLRKKPARTNSQPLSRLHSAAKDSVVSSSKLYSEQTRQLKREVLD